ncbi:MAG TPA: hypothetical protein VN493_07150 [Thermoanaerobaculia bacterium]|nr:hypothetical protein [Thermoanaerobaculia bacterium]
MSRALTIDAILSRLEARLAHHREQAEIHTRQEALHREERERHTGQMEELAHSIETFRASAGIAVELAGPPPDDDRDVDTGQERILTRLVSKLIAGRSADERFGPEGLTEEVNRRFPDILRKPARIRQISDVLRRLARSGRIHQVRRGRPHHEALYVRERPTD